jgi:hypothetical protein
VIRWENGLGGLGGWVQIFLFYFIWILSLKSK